MLAPTPKTPHEPEGQGPRSPARIGPTPWLRTIVLLLGVGVTITLVQLGNWQMDRRAWKLDLIEQINARAFAKPQSAPTGPVSSDDIAYQRVTASGRFAHDKSLLIKASSELGFGYWIMTPLKTEAQTIWVNRGFIPQRMRKSDNWDKPDGVVSLQGLVRLDEPGGTLLEQNNSETGRWVSRDIGAMSAYVGLDGAVAPYFIDAFPPGDIAAPTPEARAAKAYSAARTIAGSDEGPWPRAGLTKVKFNNHHLSYALTWYAMALLLGFGLAWTHGLLPRFRKR
ncbi:MAG: SURF1 family cytochrome oxidase biogenesis protein [Pseudomonadota bacterium]